MNGKGTGYNGSLIFYCPLINNTLEGTFYALSRLRLK